MSVTIIAFVPSTSAIMSAVCRARSMPLMRRVPSLGTAWFSLIAGREYVHLSRSVPYFAKHFRAKRALSEANAKAGAVAAKLKKKF